MLPDLIDKPLMLRPSPEVLDVSRQDLRSLSVVAVSAFGSVVGRSGPNATSHTDVGTGELVAPGAGWSALHAPNPAVAAVGLGIRTQRAR